MRCLSVALALAATLLGSACSSPYVGGGELIPAHTARLYASVSLPAVAPDGTLYVANGSKFLHLSADGELLGEGELPIKPVTLSETAGLYPRLYAIASGKVFAYFGHEDGRVGLLGDGGQMAWVHDFMACGVTAQPLGDGLLVYYRDKDKPQVGVEFVDTNGEVDWRVPGVGGEGAVPWVGADNRVCLRVGASLEVRAADSSLLLQKAFGDDDFCEEVCGAVDGTLLVLTYKYLVCLDSQGDELWRVKGRDVPFPICGAMPIRSDRSVLTLSSAAPYDYTYWVQILDGNSRQIRRFVALPYMTFYTDRDHFLTKELATSAGPMALMLYTADGAKLWQYPLPQPYEHGRIHRGEVVPSYTEGTAGVGSDGRIYFETNSTLYCLDMQGHLLWKRAGTVYFDQWVEDDYSGGFP